MAAEVMVAKRWTGPLAGFVVGLLLGGFWGYTVFNAMRAGGSAVGSAVSAQAGMFVLAAALLATIVVAGVLLLSPKRRPGSVVLAVGAVGLVAGFAIGFVLA
jgi:hypothetical protein